METTVQGPSWDLSAEYTSTQAPELEADLASVEELFDAIEALNPGLATLRVSFHAIGGDDYGFFQWHTFRIHNLAELPSVFRGA